MYNRNDDDNIERIFYSDVSEKKRTGRGCYAMKGKRGLIGKMVTPVDFMTTKQKKEYTKGGEITMSNFYNVIENVPTMDEIREKFEKDPTGAKKMIESIREIHKNKDLQKHWGTTSYSLYKFYNSLGFDFKVGFYDAEKDKERKAKYKNDTTSTKKNKVITTEAPNELIKNQQNLFDQALLIQQIQNQQNVIQNQPEDNDLFKIKYNKISCDGKQIIEKITSILTIMDYDTKYKVRLNIEEIEEEIEE